MDNQAYDMAWLTGPQYGPWYQVGPIGWESWTEQ